MTADTRLGSHDFRCCQVLLVTGLDTKIPKNRLKIYPDNPAKRFSHKSLLKPVIVDEYLTVNTFLYSSAKKKTIAAIAF